MTVDDLIQLGKQQVRNNKDLLQSYIRLFKEKFGREPNCAGCTFDHDWVKLTQQPQKTETMSNKTFDIIRTGDIFSYDYFDEKTKRTHRIRTYGNAMTEQFAEGYLTHGTDAEITERKKHFRTLPEKFRTVGSTDLNKLTVKQLQAIATEKEYPAEEWDGLKKAELIAYLDASEMEA